MGKAGRWIAAVLAVLIAGGLGWMIWARLAGARQEQRTAQGPAAVAVETAPVRRMTLRERRTFTGTLIPRAEFVAAPRIAGRLESLTVNLGDVVRRGQVVARLEDQELRLAVEQAKAELAVAQANLQQARSQREVMQREYERVASLRQQRVASESELDQAQAQLDSQRATEAVADAQVMRAQAALQTAQVRLSQAEVRAAWEEGDETRVVGERFADEGAMLAANAPVVSVLDIGALIAVVYAGERDYTRLAVGHPVAVAADAYPDRPVAGRVIRLAPQFRESSRQARVEIELPNPEGALKPGMFVRVEVELDRREDVAAVPLEAVIRREGRASVFLIEPQSQAAQLVPVALGIEDGGWVEVLEPALAGQVVTLGQHLLSDGAMVSVPEAEQGAEVRAVDDPSAEALTEGRR